MVGTPSARASGLTAETLQALTLLAKNVRQDMVRQTAEQSKILRVKGRTPAQIAIHEAQSEIRRIVRHFISGLATLVNGDTWTDQQATHSKHKLVAALEKRIQEEHPPESAIYDTAASLVRYEQFISLTPDSVREEATSLASRRARHPAAKN